MRTASPRKQKKRRPHLDAREQKSRDGDTEYGNEQDTAEQCPQTGTRVIRTDDHTGRPSYPLCDRIV
jgi:hypothetical protein